MLFRSARTEGISIIEVLAGIIVSGVLVGAIAPIFLLSTATRLQNTKAEQAASLAQSEIDRTRALIMQGIKKSDESSYLPPKTSAGLSSTAAPSKIVSEMTNPDAIAKAREVDIDEDGKADFLLQTFRDAGIRFDSGDTNDELANFQMGVRVYAITAKDNLGSLGTEPISLGLASGLGQMQTRPLAVVYTDVGRSDIDTSLVKLRCYLDSKVCSSP